MTPRPLTSSVTFGAHIVAQLPSQTRHLLASGPKRKNPEIVLTVLRTAFLAYVRVLLCLQGLYLLFLAFLFFPVGHGLNGSDIRLGWLLAPALLATSLGVAGIVAAVMLRRGRRWAAIAAILIEGLWALVAAALWYKTIKDLPLDFHFLLVLTAAAALFLVAVVGLLLRPVRAYAGLVRR
jgi:hypothetical protein